MIRFFSSEAISTSKEKINTLLNRGVEDVFVKESLEKKLLSGKKLKIKLGFDPTGSQIHIGRASILWKLKEFQDLGHEIVFVIGDFTAQIGDPSDKLEKRPMLSKEVIEKNLKTYKEQIGKIIDVKKATFVRNSTWLKKLGFEEICMLAESFSVQQMSNRRNFKERFDAGTEVSLREFLYPLMQGYDSVAIKADVEIGGFDQLFNLKAGRTVQKHYGQAEQEVLTTKMLLGTDGRKMSTSWGNVINITDSPQEMFGKTMSIRDDLIQSYFLICTKRPEEEVNKIGFRMESGENPRDIKLELAFEITKLYHGEKKAHIAQENFIEMFKNKGLPNDLVPVTVQRETLLYSVLLEQNIITSKTEWRRLVNEGAVTRGEQGEIIADIEYRLLDSAIFKIGKKRFISIEIQ